MQAAHQVYCSHNSCRCKAVRRKLKKTTVGQCSTCSSYMNTVYLGVGRLLRVFSLPWPASILGVLHVVFSSPLHNVSHSHLLHWCMHHHVFSTPNSCRPVTERSTSYYTNLATILESIRCRVHPQALCGFSLPSSIRPTILHLTFHYSPPYAPSPPWRTSPDRSVAGTPYQVQAPPRNYTKVPSLVSHQTPAIDALVPRVSLPQCDH